VLSQSTFKTPIGNLNLIAHDQKLLAAGFTSFKDLISRLEIGDQSLTLKKRNSLPVISDLLEDYFSGNLKALDGISVRQPGEKFSQAAWRAMRKVAPGTVISYSALARRAGSPAAIRAAGSACARNLIAVVIPCHRIVKTGGSLGNYAYGLDVKNWLLRHEGALQ
jgi:methylated-DNA-[protein]-cysteine S-methyltransferase